MYHYGFPNREIPRGQKTAGKGQRNMLFSFFFCLQSNESYISRLQEKSRRLIIESLGYIIPSGIKIYKLEQEMQDI